MAYGPGWKSLQIASPNVSGLLSTAQSGINKAGEAAQGILESYDKGQKSKFDAEVAQELAGIDTQEELDAWFKSGGLNGRNVSAGLLDTMLGHQGNVLDYAQNRQGMQIAGDQNTRAWNADGRAAAAEGRQATQFDWKNENRADTLERRDALREGADLFVTGEQNAFTKGLAPASLVRTESGGNFAARNNAEGAGGKGHFGRVQFGRARFAEAKAAGVVPPDMTIEQFGQDTPEAIRAQIAAEDWHFGDIQDRISSNGLEKYIGQNIGGVEITRDGMVAMAHLGGFNGMRQYLKSGGQYNPADDNGTSLSDYARTHAGNTTGSQQSGFQPTAINRGGSDYARYLIETGLFSGPEILEKIDPIRDAAVAGQGEIDSQRAAYTADLVTGITQNVVSADNFIPGDAASAEAAIRQELIDSGDYSTSKATDLAADAIKNIESSAAMSAEFNRGRTTEAQNTVINEALTNAITQANRNLAGNDQFRAMQDVERYRQAEQPHLQLATDLGIPEDPQTLGSYRPEMLRRLVNEYAVDMEVEPAVVAVAMRDVYNPDPGDDPYSSFWYDNDLTLNTLRNQFDKAAVKAAADQLTPERMAEYDRARTEIEILETRLEQNALQQRQILSQMNRFEASGNTDDSRYQNLSKRLDRLINDAAILSKDTSEKTNEEPERPNPQIVPETAREESSPAPAPRAPGHPWGNGRRQSR